MKVHVHTKLCIICLLTFAFHQCSHCHDNDSGHVADVTHSHNDYQISTAPYIQREREVVTKPEVSRSAAPEAEHEQKYYIEKLFDRYGENGRLSFYGLEKLLTNLGLGEVKVVEMNHEDIGHDHVSHLDVLDMQEGKHHHTHDYLHSHSNSENHTLDVELTVRNVSCDLAKGETSEHEHEHEHAHTNTHEQPPHRHRHHKDSHSHHHPHHKGPHPHEHNHTHHSSNESVKHTDHLESNHVHEISRSSIHINDSAKASQEYLVQSPSNENQHHRNHKREAPHNQHGVDHRHEECLNVTQLLQYYRLKSPISPDQFTYLCPALLYQIDRRFCIKHYRELHVEDLPKDKSGASAWVCGLISITVISLLSLLGVVLIPIINQGCFRFLLSFLVALAVGTLSGDALLHLLPHSVGGHDHSHENSGQDPEAKISNHNESKVDNFLETYDPVMKGLVALGGIYLLFIIEHCLRMFKHYKENKGKRKWLKKTQKVEDATIGRKLSDHKLNRRSDAEWLQLKPLAGGGEDSVVVEGQNNDTELTDLEAQKEFISKSFLSLQEEEPMHHIHKDADIAAHGDHENESHEGEHDLNHGNNTMSKKYKHHKHRHSHHSHGHCHSSKDMKDTGIASIAWMVIMGDGMHNFSDGLAIGAAFSAGLTGGISTSVAVFCHELPHELGDFAVLINAGMTVKQAIWYNLLSAMMAYVGMLIGTSVGQYANTVTLWIFAITAGMFLYVALVDMLPEMLHGDVENGENGFCAIGQFMLQNLGLLLGFTLMLIIALYEDKIVFDFNL